MKLSNLEATLIIATSALVNCGGDITSRQAEPHTVHIGAAVKSRNDDSETKEHNSRPKSLLSNKACPSITTVMNSCANMLHKVSGGSPCNDAVRKINFASQDLNSCTDALGPHTDCEMKPLDKHFETILKDARDYQHQLTIDLSQGLSDLSLLRCPDTESITAQAMDNVHKWVTVETKITNHYPFLR